MFGHKFYLFHDSTFCLKKGGKERLKTCMYITYFQRNPGGLHSVSTLMVQQSSEPLLGKGVSLGLPSIPSAIPSLRVSPCFHP